MNEYLFFILVAGNPGDSKSVTWILVGA